MNPERVKLALTVNGTAVEREVAPARRAIDVIRADLGLNGVKEGCGTGECGACAVIVDGEPRLSCLLLAGELEGRTLTTIEATRDPRIESMKRAFLAEDALQCGFCTPGLILVASRIPVGAGDEEIRRALVGNLCRCTGYASVVRAVRRAHEDAPSGEGAGEAGA